MVVQLRLNGTHPGSRGGLGVGRELSDWAPHVPFSLTRHHQIDHETRASLPMPRASRSTTSSTLTVGRRSHRGEQSLRDARNFSLSAVGVKPLSKVQLVRPVIRAASVVLHYMPSVRTCIAATT